MSSFAERRKFFESKSQASNEVQTSFSRSPFRRSVAFKEASSSVSRGIGSSSSFSSSSSSSSPPAAIIHHSSLKSIQSDIILLLGQSGSGKSSVTNAVLGGKKQVALESSAMESCTSNIDVFEGPWLGKGNEMITVIDTPGFFDTERRDSEFLSQLVTFLRDFPPSKLRVVIITLPITESRSASTYTRMIDQVELLFGKDVWDHTLFLTTLHNHFNPHRDYDDLRKLKEEEWRKWLRDECSLPHAPISPFQYGTPELLQPVISKFRFCKPFTPKSSEKIALFLQSNPSASPMDVISQVEGLRQMKADWEWEMQDKIRRTETAKRNLETRKNQTAQQQKDIQAAEQKIANMRATVAAGPRVVYV
mmetsp:Transcript_18629/g.29198  ORF Transcript_18629/g.29198 Transcript_18629/m.29198 type:complete len:363 (-) Transcript_18629:132-1220(-)|eukprot:CAMPEP_0201534494 /NCGR_PEP_ID=MMETSP0161_2-20130828/56430_1 /ASSEMBLY_ACC=CAM_ASM_000251 /TAXON_ID=180227 /ORGANISM="Neoparamoeba aestuarina, Strain SoJaBio B1-5/56/2" /LENGTH=362 /DNA_ID=CAMNT_0047939151 /DNA_START=229 /DNA_END=1317 /DNA_ORIENTATION=+